MPADEGGGHHGPRSLGVDVDASQRPVERPRGQTGRSRPFDRRPGDVHFAILTDVPRAQLALPGDTVMTTGFDGVFPADVAVGLVEDALGGKGDEFQTLLVKLGANYPGARHVLWA